MTKEKRNAYLKIWRERNKERLKKYFKDYYDKKGNEYHKKYQEENKDKIREYKREYFQLNKDKIYKKSKQRMIDWARNKLHTDIDFKLRQYLRNRVRDALKRNSKFETTMNLVGCSLENLKLHLQNHFKNDMSWSNHGKWEIDHIIPCASFDLSKTSEQKKCFHYSNLQPLWMEENRTKSNKIERIN